MYQAIHHSLEKGVAREDLQGPLEGTDLPGDGCLVLTTDPKPRLRWTAELHERFVDAVTQLGGHDRRFHSTMRQTMIMVYKFMLKGFKHAEQSRQLNPVEMR